MVTSIDYRQTTLQGSERGVIVYITGYEHVDIGRRRRKEIAASPSNHANSTNLA
ncbi:MAG: hypothetical protein WC655_11860 [Candidatus Hydrogenedentales bacterium]